MSDAKSIFAFDHVAQTSPPRREFLVRAIAGGSCLVAETDGRVVAYGVIEHSFFGHGFIPLVYVAGAWRRKGIGTELMQHLEGVCATPKLFTSTNSSNEPMRRLLANLGYAASGVIENLDEGDPELVFYKIRPAT